MHLKTDKLKNQTHK